MPGYDGTGPLGLGPMTGGGGGFCLMELHGASGGSPRGFAGRPCRSADTRSPAPEGRRCCCGEECCSRSEAGGRR